MPKTQQFSFTVPGSPEQVAERLKSQTRFHPLPVQGTVLVPADRPLAGRVSKRGFTVAVNKRDWLTLMQAVAKGEISEVPGGTQVQGQARLPVWVTLQLRIATIIGILAGLVGVVGVVAGAPGMASASMAALFLCVVLMATVLGIGLNVRNADEQIPELMARLEAAAIGPVADEQAVEDEQTEQDQAKARAAARQAQGQHQG